MKVNHVNKGKKIMSRINVGYKTTGMQGVGFMVLKTRIIMGNNV
jgi:hypothetical protein